MAKGDEFSRHEALHMSCFLMNAVEAELMDNAHVKHSPEWKKSAKAAHKALFDLYQAIGAEHLGDSE